MISIRASSLPDLFDCPARWEARNILGMTIPTSGAAQLGTAVHKSTALYDVSVIAGSPLTVDDAAGAAIDAIHHAEYDVEWDEDMNKGVAEKIAVSLHRKYCERISPYQEYVGVEVNCKRLDITDLDISLTGTTDRVRRTKDGDIGISDLKTGATAVNAQGEVKTAGHIAQLAVYELLASQAIGQQLTAPAQIVGLQTGKTEKAQRVGVAEVEAPSQLLVGDESCPGLLQIASGLLHKGLFFGNPRSMLCSAKYCPAYGSCRFRG